jgi:HPt (histidine-containing phosphotransfer) domain-containing protein
MRGKAAAKSANRRATGAQQRCHELEQELRQLRKAHREQLDQLTLEITRLNSELMHRAGDLASEEIANKTEQAARAWRNETTASAVARASLVAKDKFIRNACRYISMTKGYAPPDALTEVLTWATDADFYGFGANPMHWVAKVGVPPNGWTATVCRTISPTMSKSLTRYRRARGETLASCLDNVEQKLDQYDIHPDYKSHWYPPVKYRDLELIDEETAS